jgi:predicted dehydrogenase
MSASPNPIRWGILATGNVASSMAQALSQTPDAEIVAVASRSQETADRFGERWGIGRRYDSYHRLAEDTEVDVVYVATPHSQHHANVLACLHAGKHVLCEKPLTLNAGQAAECIDLARRRSLFLMEAMWMRFFPAMQQVRDWLRQDVIGPVRLVQADFCLRIPFDPQHRLYSLALGGGALLDMGVYPLSLASMVLGIPQRTQGHAVIGPTGVDELDAVVLGYEGGATAALMCSMTIYKPREAFIVGSQGYIKVHDVFFRPHRLTLHLAGGEPQTSDHPYTGNGYRHEIDEVHACLRAGRTESELMPLDETLGLLRLMDRLRADWGIRYPEEG